MPEIEKKMLIPGFFLNDQLRATSLLRCSLPFLVLGMAAPNLFALARQVSMTSFDFDSSRLVFGMRRLVPIMLECLRAVIGRCKNAFVKGHCMIADCTVC